MTPRGPEVRAHHPAVADVFVSITIEQPIDDVFAVLTTPELTPRWSSNAIEEHITSPGPIAVGSRRQATVRRIGGGTTQNEIEVIALDPGRRIAVRSVESPVPFTSAWSFTSTGPATRVDWEWHFTMRGWMRPFDRLLGWSFTRTFRTDLARLKMLMESGAL
jgi:uncharacterized protein YndB with AHSA1/START domain